MKLVHQSSRDTPCSVTLESKSFCMADGKRRVPANFLTFPLVLLIVTALAISGSSLTLNGEEPRFVDHSLLIAPELPCTWPSHPFPRFAIGRWVAARWSASSSW